MKVFLIVLILGLLFWGAYAALQERHNKAFELAQSYGEVVTFESRAFGRGPFWYADHKSTSVFYVEYKDGRTAYICEGLFHHDIKFE